MVELLNKTGSYSDLLTVFVLIFVAFVHMRSKYRRTVETMFDVVTAMRFVVKSPMSLENKIKDMKEFSNLLNTDPVIKHLRIGKEIYEFIDLAISSYSEQLRQGVKYDRNYD